MSQGKLPRRRPEYERVDTLPKGQDQPLPDDLNGLPVPIQSAVNIDPEAVHFTQSNHAEPFGPLGRVGRLKRDAPKFFLALGRYEFQLSH